jgi:hypothetical protein
LRGAPGGGKTIALAAPAGVLETSLGMIASAPAGHADFTDQRYWVKAQFTNQASGDGLDASLVFADKVPAVQDGEQADWFPLVATNLAEVPTSGGGSGTHLLSIGQMVQYFAAYDPCGVKRYVFWQAPVRQFRAVLVTIQTDADGPGVYFGSIISGFDNGPPTSTGSGGDIDPNASSYALPSAERSGVIVLNLMEANTDTHDLTYIPGSGLIAYMGYVLQYNSDGTPVVVICALGATDCT